MRQPHIVADVYEQKSGVPDCLRGLGADIVVQRLASADYDVGDDTLVERKSVLDLHSSIVSGRLWPQIGRLRAAARYPFLLIEGNDLDVGPVEANAIRGTCLAAIRLGIRLIQTRDGPDTARWLYLLARQRQRTGPVSRSQHRCERQDRAT